MNVGATPVLAVEKTVEFVPAGAYGNYAGSNAGGYVLWFIVLTIIFWFLLYALRPVSVQYIDEATGKPTGQVDGFKALIGALIIALIIILLIWLFQSANRC